MGIFYRVSKIAALGILGISLVTVASLTSQAQNTKNSVVRVVPEKNIAPARIMLRRRAKPVTRPLSRVEQESILKSTMESIALQKALHPNLDLQLVSIGSSHTFSFDSSPMTLSTEQPWIKNAGWLLYSSATVGGYPDDPYIALWGDTGPGHGAYLAVIVNLSAGKNYVLDFTADQFDVTKFGQAIAPMEIRIEPPSGPGVSMEMSVTKGHLLVPMIAGSAGWYIIDVYCYTGWQFSSVTVNQLS
jgi:hypothetical protein